MKRFVTMMIACLGTIAVLPATTPISMTPLGTVKSGPLTGADPRIAEINAYDVWGRRIYVVNPTSGMLDVIDADDPAAPIPDLPVNIVAACEAAMGLSCPVLAGSEPNSVAIRWPIMAVAVANPVRTDHGHAVLFWLRGDAPPLFLAAVEVGALPDMVTFSESGRYVLDGERRRT